MEHRRIGKTEMMASVIGLGAEHLDKKPYEQVEEVIHCAIDRGINIMDLFMATEEIRKDIGKALRGKRDKMLIQGHIGSIMKNGQYGVSRDINVCKKYFEDLMRFLETDYIDIGMLFFIDSEPDFQKVLQSGMLDYAKDLKKEGKIRAIGASSHNPEIAKKVVKTGILDLLMFSINPAFDMMPPSADIYDLLDGPLGLQIGESRNPERAELYKLCEHENVAVTVMKTLGGGKLLSPQHTPFNKPMSVAQCISYALSRPAVVSALVGCKSKEEVLEATRYFEIPDDEKDYALIINDFEVKGKKCGSFAGSCVYCNHCLPCPSNIDIGAVHKYLDIAVLDEKNVPPSILQHYDSLENHGSDCIKCGQCESRCPFSVKIMSNMERAEGLFGK